MTILADSGLWGSALHFWGGAFQEFLVFTWLHHYQKQNWLQGSLIFSFWSDHNSGSLIPHWWQLRQCWFPSLSQWAGIENSFPGGLDSKESTCNAGDLGSIPGLGRSPGEGNGNLFQDSCLENSMHRGAWQSMGSQRVRKDWTTFTFTFKIRPTDPFSHLKTKPN